MYPVAVADGRISILPHTMGHFRQRVTVESKLWTLHKPFEPEPPSSQYLFTTLPCLCEASMLVGLQLYVEGASGVAGNQLVF